MVAGWKDDSVGERLKNTRRSHWLDAGRPVFWRVFFVEHGQMELIGHLIPDQARGLTNPKRLRAWNVHNGFNQSLSG